MAVLQSLRAAAGAVGRNPILFVVAAAFSLLQLPSFVAQSISPLLGSLLSLVTTLLFVFVFPFLFGGLIGMANEALSGRTRLDTFVESGTDHYLSMLGGYLLVVGVSIALGIAVFGITVFVGALVGGVAVAGMSGGAGLGGAGAALLGIVGVLLLGGFVLYLLVVFFIQFYGHAIVVDDLGAVAGIKRSIACVRHNLLTVFGYSLVVGAVGALFGLFGGVFSLLTTPRLPASGGMGGAGGPPATPDVVAGIPSVGLVGVLVLGLVFLALSGLVGGFMAVYSTAVYRGIRPTA